MAKGLSRLHLNTICGAISRSGRQRSWLAMRRLTSSNALILVLAFGLGACGDDELPRTTAVAATGEQEMTQGCDRHVEPLRPAGDAYRGVTLRWGQRLLNIEPAGPPSKVTVAGQTRWLWKAPIGLSADTTAELRITGAGAAGFVEAGEVTESRIASRAVLKSCPADTPLFSSDGTVGPVTGFAFAFITGQPSCSGLQIEARVDSQLRTAPLGRGKACRPAG